MKKILITSTMLTITSFASSSILAEEVNKYAMCYLSISVMKENQSDAKKNKVLKDMADGLLNKFLQQGNTQQNFYDELLKLKPEMSKMKWEEIRDIAQNCGALYEQNVSRSISTSFSKEDSNQNSNKTICYYSEGDGKDKNWATGGIRPNSCDPENIRNMITAPYGSVLIWSYKNDHEILYTNVFSSASGTPTSYSVHPYTKKKNLIIKSTGKNPNCLTTESIISDTSDYLIVDHKGLSGECDEITLQLGKNLVGKTKYIKIRN